MNRLKQFASGFRKGMHEYRSAEARTGGQQSTTVAQQKHRSDYAWGLLMLMVFTAILVNALRSGRLLDSRTASGGRGLLLSLPFHPRALALERVAGWRPSP